MWSDKQETALRYLEHERHREVEEVLFGGSAGGGKSFLGTMWQIARRIKYPGTRGLIGRATLKKLKLTTLRTFNENWSTYFEGKQDVECHTNHQDNVIYFSNGSEIILMDLSYMPSDPDFARLGSLELTDAFLDEVSEITEKAYNILNSRIRYKLINGVAKCLSASNPANNWLKSNFVSNDNNIPVQLPDYRKFVPSLVTDNPNKEFVKAYVRKLERLPLYDRKRLLEGDWSIRENDSPFFASFNRDKHVSNAIEINEWLPLLFSFDFNMDPTTCIVFQQDLPNIYIWDCVQVKGGTKVLCDILKDEYEDHPAGIEATGDNSGYAASSVGGLKNGTAITDFEVIKEALNLSPYDIKRPSKVNPRHTTSRKIINYAFDHLNIRVHPRCKALIEDLLNAQVDDKGRLVKDREANKQDAGDAFRYGIHLILPKGIKTINQYIEQKIEE